MRVAPLGAWFADDERSLVAEAAASAAVTHAHPEGQAGAIAVALATSLACRCRVGADSATPAVFIKTIADKTPEGAVREGLEKSIALLGASPADAARELGDGTKVIAADTVPFAIWCAARSLQSFENAIWSALGGLLAPEADRDTVCAIVGGIVSVSAPVPVAWVSARETLE